MGQTKKQLRRNEADAFVLLTETKELVALFDFTEVADWSAAAIFCLGTYTGSISDAELRKITVD